METAAFTGFLVDRDAFADTLARKDFGDELWHCKFGNRVLMLSISFIDQAWLAALYPLCPECNACPVQFSGEVCSSGPVCEYYSGTDVLVVYAHRLLSAVGDLSYASDWFGLEPLAGTLYARDLYEQSLAFVKRRVAELENTHPRILELAL